MNEFHCQVQLGVSGESQSTIHKEEPCLDLEGVCFQTYVGCFLLEKTHSCVYTGIFAGLPVVTGLFFM